MTGDHRPLPVNAVPPPPVPWARHADVTLLELVDRALHKGVVLWGEVTLSVADVDLIYLGLKLLLCSAETAERMRAAATPSGRADGGSTGGAG